MDAVKKALRVAKADGGLSSGNAPVGAVPATQSASTFDPTSYVTGLYKDIINREGEAAGIKGWVDALQSNAMTPEQVRQGFLASSENTVQDLYGNLLKRNTLDPNAYNWVNALESGNMTPAQIRSGIMESEEYKKLNPIAATQTSGAGGNTPVDITKQGMPLIYTPPPYKDYGATPAAFRVASGLENLPAPFATLSPVVRPVTPNPETGGGTYKDVLKNLNPSTPVNPNITQTNTATTNNIGITADDIAALYSQYLGRSPEEGAAERWMDALGQGKLTYREIANEIQRSPEASVYSDYKNILGRGLDPGAQGWINAIASGQMTPDQVRASIQGSSEAQGRGVVPSTTNPASSALNDVKAAYETFLGRSAEPGAAEAWANAVASGQITLQDALNSISSSAEAQARSGGYYNRGGSVKGYADGGSTYEDLINAAYKDFLGRESDPEGLKSWLNALTSGKIKPADFESQFKGAGYEDDIYGAYNKELGRSPSQEEINRWNNALTNKEMTLDQVMQRISRSPEATSRQYYESVPTSDKFSELQDGRMYDIDIGRVERIPELGRMAAPVNVKQAWENSEIARLQAELEAAKKAGMGSTTDNRSGAGDGTGGGGGSNFGAADATGTVGGIGQDPAAGPAGPDAPGTGPGEKYGGRINAVDNALRMLKADRH